MKLDLRPDLDTIDIVSDHSFLFEAHARDLRTLITRYRGTAVRRIDAGWAVVAWQKSVYHFGGLNREVPVLATVRLDEAGRVQALEFDEGCSGSQGRRCDFRALEEHMFELIKETAFVQFHSYCLSAAAARCLHLFELLDGASGFFAHLQGLGLAEGSEQEILRIRPYDGGLAVENRHIVLGRESDLCIDLRHLDPPRRNDRGLPEYLHAAASVTHQGEPAFSQELEADDFREVYTALNLLFADCFRLDRKALELPGRRRERFANWPALAGLLLLTISHESMAGGLSRAIRIEKILHFIQTGEGRTGCIGFGG